MEQTSSICSENKFSAILKPSITIFGSIIDQIGYSHLISIKYFPSQISQAILHHLTLMALLSLKTMFLITKDSLIAHFQQLRGICVEYQFVVVSTEFNMVKVPFAL